jgi:hypothetical protein
MSSNGILMAFRAETLLGNADILARIDSLRNGLQYATEGNQVSFDDQLQKLRDAVDEIPKLELETDVAPGTENYYSVQLITSMERIMDACEYVSRRLSKFQGRLRDAERQINNLKAEFMAWYILAATEMLSGMEDVKLATKEVRALSEAEFSRMMRNMDLKVESVLDDLKLEFERISQHKATQKEKHNLGKDQANASWTSLLPAFGSAIPTNERTDKQTRPQDLDDVDENVSAFVSHRPKISDVKGDVQAMIDKAKPGDTVVVRNFENVGQKIAEIKEVKQMVKSMDDWDDDADPTPKGTFKKTVTAVAEVVKDESGQPAVMESPRRRLVFDEEL